MTRSTHIDPLEARLRGTLEELRPADGAPASLRSRVDGLPEHMASPGFVGRLRGLLVSPSTVAVVIAGAAILALAVAFKGGVPAPYDNVGGAPHPTFDPTVEGPGMLHGPIPTLLVAAVISVLLAARLVRHWRAIVRLDTWLDIGRGVALVALLAIPTSLVLEPAVRDQGGSLGPVLGFGIPVDPPPGSDSAPVYYVTAEPGAPFIVLFDIANGSALPVTVDGIVSESFVSSDPTATSDPTRRTGPEWTALALPSIPNIFPNGMDQLRPFTPTVVASNQLLTLYLVGKAGSCAFGAGYTPDTIGVTSYASMTRAVHIGYSILGLSTTTSFTMPLQVVEPESSRCV